MLILALDRSLAPTSSHGMWLLPISNGRQELNVLLSLRERDAVLGLASRGA